MIIDFTVENYRSIHEPITLSFLPEGASIADIISGASKPLSAIGIFGEECPGSTHFLDALYSLFLLMTRGTSMDSRENSYYENNKGTFIFSHRDDVNPLQTRFEIRIVLQEEVYTYTLHLTPSQFDLERLTMSTAKRPEPQILFDRTWDHDAYKHHYEINLTCEIEKLFEALETFFPEPLMPYGNNFSLSSLKSWTIQASMHSFSIALADIQKLLIFDVPDLNDIASKAFPVLLSLIPDQVYVPSIGPDFTSMGPWSFIREASWNSALYPGTTPQNDKRWDTALRIYQLFGKTLEGLLNGTPVLVDQLDRDVPIEIAEITIRLFQNPIANPRQAQFIFTAANQLLAHWLSPAARNSIQISSDGYPKLSSISSACADVSSQVDRGNIERVFEQLVSMLAQTGLLHNG